MSYTINFPLNPGRKLAIAGDSDLRGLPVIFTLDETAILERNGEDLFYRYQTDKAGMVSALQLGQAASDGISRAVDVIGKLLVHADLSELSEADRGILGWTICGLGELSAQVNEASFAIAKALADGRYLEESSHAETR